MLAPVAFISWLPGTTWESISDVERNYSRCRGAVNDIFAPKMHFETVSGFYFTARDCSVIFMAFEQFSREVLNFGFRDR